MLKLQEIKTIKNLLQVGLSVSEISRRVGKSLPTIYRIRNEFNFSDSYKKDGFLSKSKELIPFESYINKRTKAGITNIKKLHEELKMKGYKGSYTSLYRYKRLITHLGILRKYKPSCRFETEPGEQAQIDWGSCGKIEVNNRDEQLYCFSYLLGYSRAMYVEFTIKQNLQTFENCHIHAFKSIGIPKILVYDNIKTVVLKREKLPDGTKRIHFNPAFLDFSHHYGFEIKLCGPRWPRSKGKVESSIAPTFMIFVTPFSKADLITLSKSSSKAWKFK